MVTGRTNGETRREATSQVPESKQRQDACADRGPRPCACAVDLQGRADELVRRGRGQDVVKPSSVVVIRERESFSRLKKTLLLPAKKKVI